MNDYTTQRRKRLERLEALKRRNGLAPLPSDRPALRGRQSPSPTKPPSQLRSPILKRPKQRTEKPAGTGPDSASRHPTSLIHPSKPTQQQEGPLPRLPSGKGATGPRPFSWHARPNAAQTHTPADHPSNEETADKPTESLLSRASSYRRPTPAPSSASNIIARCPGQSPLLDTRPQPSDNQENDSPPSSYTQRSTLPPHNRPPRTSVATVTEPEPSLAFQTSEHYPTE
ncbi:hypothetical protein H4R34_005955, partial [Dimargaris verticillata]